MPELGTPQPRTFADILPGANSSPSPRLAPMSATGIDLFDTMLVSGPPGQFSPFCGEGEVPLSSARHAYRA